MFEKLLSLFERAVVALEKLATASTPDASAATQPPETAPKQTRTRKASEQPPAPPAGDDDFLNEAPAATQEVTYERADVKQALQEYGKKHGMEKAQKLFKDVSGVAALSDLPIEKFAAVINATKK